MTTPTRQIDHPRDKLGLDEHPYPDHPMGITDSPGGNLFVFSMSTKYVRPWGHIFCHLAFDCSADPVLVFIPTDLTFFMNFETNYHRQRLPAGVEGPSLPKAPTSKRDLDDRRRADPHMPTPERAMMFERCSQYINWVFGPESTSNKAIARFTPLLVPDGCHSVYQDLTWLLCLLFC